ncbi:MAG: galactosyltransferase-related protein, partial [Arenimonas sp.]
DSLLKRPPESIMQNSEGGGSIAITRKAYEEIGGFDESFIGWGGEDNEFWERAKTRRLWPYAFLPIVHLWHAAQPGKAKLDNQTLSLYQKRSEVSPEIRIAKLRAMESGNLSGPVGYRVVK